MLDEKPGTGECTASVTARILGDDKNLVWLQERMAVAISAVAASEVAADQTLAYMKRRQVFGRRLGDLQYPAITVGTAHERRGVVSVGLADLRSVGSLVS